MQKLSQNNPLYRHALVLCLGVIPLVACGTGPDEGETTAQTDSSSTGGSTTGTNPSTQTTGGTTSGSTSVGTTGAGSTSVGTTGAGSTSVGTTSGTTSRGSTSVGTTSGTTTGGSGTSTGGTTTGTTTGTVNTCTPDTWENYAMGFFTTNCQGCHGTEFSTLKTVQNEETNIQSEIQSKKMPEGAPLSTSDYNRILKWFSCNLPD